MFKIVLITVPSVEEATRLATGLVTEQFAACVNIIPGITSIYTWQGAVQTDTECLLIGKTTQAQWDGLVDWVKQHHSYEVPEIIQLPILAGSSEYLHWLEACVAK